MRVSVSGVLLTAFQVEAMELDTLTPELPKLLIEMGIKYDPERLTEALDRRRGVLYSRAAQVGQIERGP